MFKKGKGRPLPLPVGIAVGIGVALFIAVLGAAISAWMISGERLGENAGDILSPVIHLLSAGIGAIIASYLTKEKLLFAALGSGLGYIVLLLSATALVFGGQYSGVLTGTLMALLGCSAVILFSLKGKKPRKRPMHHKKYR